MTKLILILLLGSHPHPTTFYLPMATQDARPFCVSNRSRGPVRIPNGPTIEPNQMVRASVVTDFDWGFTIPEKATERGDVDCFVVSK